jgi:hypothetical protein
MEISVAKLGRKSQSFATEFCDRFVRATGYAACLAAMSFSCRPHIDKRYVLELARQGHPWRSPFWQHQDGASPIGKSFELTFDPLAIKRAGTRRPAH